MSQRNQNLDDMPLVDLLLSTGKHDIAVEHVEMETGCASRSRLRCV